jgi:adenylate kinase family enzyme
MKIAIIGYSGSGKSTLAAYLGQQYNIPVLHLDTVRFLPNWVERDKDEEAAIVKDFMDRNAEGGWVIDGNYTSVHYDRRMAEADRILFLAFSRFACLYRATKRYRTWRGRRRPSAAEGCNEKLDRAFVKWILLDGRTKARRARYRQVAARYPEKFVRIKNQRALTAYMARVKAESEGNT